MKKAQRVGLRELAHVHEFAQQFCRARDIQAEDRIARLGAGEQVTNRTDSADAGCDLRHLGEIASLAELFEAAELNDMKPGIRDVAYLIQVDGDLRVALDARDRIDGDDIRHNSASSHP